jgi:hypothetical protein
MSLSNPKLTNPAKKFIEWKGSKGVFQYYDKDTEKNIELPLPLYFIVLDQLSTVTGFSERLGCGIYSNEVRSTKNEVLHVKSFKSGVHISGLWNDINDEVKAAAGKYCKTVYAMLIKGKSDFELVCFKMHGSAFSGTEKDNKDAGWINFKADLTTFGVQVKTSLPGERGVTKFIAPVFETCTIKDQKIWDAAIKMDQQLQVYFSQYFSKDVLENEPEVPIDTEPDHGDLPPGDFPGDGLPPSETQPDPNFMENNGLTGLSKKEINNLPW